MSLQIAIIRITLLLVSGMLGVLAWAGFRFYVLHPRGLWRDLRTSPGRAILGLMVSIITILILGCSIYLIAVALAVP